MQTANIMLSLGGDHGTTVPKYNITAAEIAVLRLIHGNDAVRDIEPSGNIERTHREEIDRLRTRYGRAKIDNGEGDQVSAVNALFPGAAARVFTSLDELEIPEEFYKAEKRVKPTAKAEAPAADKAVDDMTKKELVAFAEQNAIEIDPNAKKDDILAVIKGGPDPEQEATPVAQESAEEASDEALFG